VDRPVRPPGPHDRHFHADPHRQAALPVPQDAVMRSHSCVPRGRRSRGWRRRGRPLASAIPLEAGEAGVGKLLAADQAGRREILDRLGGRLVAGDLSVTTGSRRGRRPAERGGPCSGLVSQAPARRRGTGVQGGGGPARRHAPGTAQVGQEAARLTTGRCGRRPCAPWQRSPPMNFRRSCGLPVDERRPPCARSSFARS
jgi:hypothetical protein